MEENATKGLCMALLFIDTLLFGWPPYLLVRGKNQSARAVRIRTTIISYLSCFGGGVFLGACLLHLLAEGREVMEEYFVAVGKEDLDFPVYECVVAVGFFAIALVEQIAHGLLHKSQHVGHHSHEKDYTSPRPDPGSFSLEGVDKSKHIQPLGVDNPSFNNGSKPERTTHLPTLELKPADGFKNGNSYIITQSPGKDIADTRYHSDSPIPSRESDSVAVISSGDAKGVKKVRQSFDHGHIHREHDPHDSESGHDHGDEVVQMIKTMEVNPLRAFLLLGALSFHTIFDGLAVGLQGKNKDIWAMFTAICIHKTLVAVCLGLQLFLAFRSKPIMGFIWVFVFSLISPIGVGIGMAVSSGGINNLAKDLINWILQGMATGTFLYVTIFEILHEELGKNGGILKILVTVIGFGGMAVAKYFDKD